MERDRRRPGHPPRLAPTDSSAAPTPPGCQPSPTCGCSCSCGGAGRRRPPRRPSSAASAGPGSSPQPPGSSAGTPSGHPAGQGHCHPPRCSAHRGRGTAVHPAPASPLRYPTAGGPTPAPRQHPEERDGARRGGDTHGLTSGQNSITSRYGVTSAHWARHCRRLVCWRALGKAKRWGGLHQPHTSWSGGTVAAPRQPSPCPLLLRWGPARRLLGAPAVGTSTSQRPGTHHKGTFVLLCDPPSALLCP